MSIPGFIHPVEVLHLEDMMRAMGPDAPRVMHLATNYKYQDAEVDDIDAEMAARAIAWVDDAHARESGSILCFLPVRQLEAPLS